MLPLLPGNRMFANSNLISEREREREGGGERNEQFVNSLFLSTRERKRSPYLFVGSAKSWMRFVALAASVFGWIHAYGAGTCLRTDTVCRWSCRSLWKRKPSASNRVSIGGAYRPRTRNYSRWIVFFGNVFRSRHRFDSLRGAPPQRWPPNAVRIRLKMMKEELEKLRIYSSVCCPTVIQGGYWKTECFTRFLLFYYFLFYFTLFYFIFLFGNIIDGFFSVLSVKNKWPFQILFSIFQ